jgi:hypothetical protein
MNKETKVMTAEEELDEHFNSMTFEGEITGDVNPDFLCGDYDEIDPDLYMNGNPVEGEDEAVKAALG